MAELSLDLQKLESVPSALDIIRFLSSQPEGYADTDDICDGLDISERRFGKANRRLVTTGYVQMRTDYVYELTTKGRAAAEELAAYDASAPAQVSDEAPRLSRKLLVALPNTLVASQAAPVHIGFPKSDAFTDETNIVVQLKAVHATLQPDSDRILSLGAGHLVDMVTITPATYDQVRLMLEVFQLSPSGDDVSACGGMFIDVPVSAQGEAGGLVAYGVDLEFDPA